jgi:hypothetical protein
MKVEFREYFMTDMIVFDDMTADDTLVLIGVSLNERIL